MIEILHKTLVIIMNLLNNISIIHKGLNWGLLIETLFIPQELLLVVLHINPY
jgi:hypothetical protein